MTTSIHTKLVLLVAALITFSTLGHSTAVAEPPAAVRVNPGWQPVQPRLGFFGAYNGYGLVVTSVDWGSRAHRMGLERGDVILAVNGTEIRSYQHYLFLMRQSGGFVDLDVEDVRTGRIVQLSDPRIQPGSAAVVGSAQ